MADMSKIQPLSPHHHPLQEEPEEENGRISSPQTLANPITNSSNLIEAYNDDEDDDLVNVDARDVLPYAFNFDLNSSFFLPSTSLSHPEVNSKNSCSCCSCESESESELESESDCHDSTVYPDCLYAHEDEEQEEYDQMDFITDLFDSRGEIGHVSGSLSRSDVGISVTEAINDRNDDFVSGNIEELGLGLGFEGGGGGLRVVGIESDSDTEELGQVNDQNNERIQIDSNLERFWDCPASDTARVDDHAADRDQLSSVIDRIEEISVSSEISSEGDSAVGVLEWEILLAVNNLERDLEFETNGDEGFVYTAEFDTLIGQFVETVRALRGSPPAAKSIIDNLPLVVLKTSNSKDGDQEGHDRDQDQDCVVCAVCKDEISVEEKVTQLPCRHHYHGDCIVPWLSIRNTCPVCRFELPTDDVDYERSKNRVNDDELVVGYGSELSP